MKKVMVLFLTLLFFFGLSSYSMAQKATKEECIQMCKKAAQMAKEKGIDAMLKAVADPHGPFVWKDSYVFALDIEKKVLVAHPIKPKLVGNPRVYYIKDKNGKMFFAEFVKIAKEKGEGWVDYWWPKPGEKKLSHKITYVLRVPGTSIAVAAGVYE